MEFEQPVKKRKIWPVVVLVFLFSVLIGCAVAFLIFANHPGKAEEETPVIPPAPTPTAASSRVLMAGTTFWGRRTNNLARKSELGVAYPFSQLSTLKPEDYNSWITNLECPITDNGHDPYNEDTLLKFNCDPDYLPEASKYFKVFSLGTNHVDNWDEVGIETTKQNLKQYGIQYFGSTKYDDGENNCSVIVIPTDVTYSDGEKKSFSIPFGFCSAHGVFGIPTVEVRANIESYAKIIPTIVMPHMGAEYKDSADDIRTALYHEMIDLGAEMVVADHPHWIQNTEAYNGKLIAYSLGNFMFDQTFNEEVSRGAALDATVTIENPDDIKNLEAWDELGKICLENDGDCLDEIKSAGLKKMDLSWKFDMFGTTSAGDCITRLASESEQQAILNRLNWQETVKSLK